MKVLPNSDPPGSKRFALQANLHAGGGKVELSRHECKKKAIKVLNNLDIRLRSGDSVGISRKRSRPCESVSTFRGFEDTLFAPLASLFCELQTKPTIAEIQLYSSIRLEVCAIMNGARPNLLATSNWRKELLEWCLSRTIAEARNFLARDFAKTNLEGSPDRTAWRDSQAVNPYEIRSDPPMLFLLCAVCLDCLLTLEELLSAIVVRLDEESLDVPTMTCSEERLVGAEKVCLFSSRNVREEPGATKRLDLRKYILRTFHQAVGVLRKADESSFWKLLRAMFFCYINCMELFPGLETPTQVTRRSERYKRDGDDGRLGRCLQITGNDTELHGHAAFRDTCGMDNNAVSRTKRSDLLSSYIVELLMLLIGEGGSASGRDSVPIMAVLWDLRNELCSSGQGVGMFSERSPSDERTQTRCRIMEELFSRLFLAQLDQQSIEKTLASPSIGCKIADVTQLPVANGNRLTLIVHSRDTGRDQHDRITEDGIDSDKAGQNVTNRQNRVVNVQWESKHDWFSQVLETVGLENVFNMLYQELRRKANNLQPLFDVASLCYAKGLQAQLDKVLDGCEPASDWGRRVSGLQSGFWLKCEHDMVATDFFSGLSHRLLGDGIVTKEAHLIHLSIDIIEHLIGLKTILVHRLGEYKTTCDAKTPKAQHDLAGMLNPSLLPAIETLKTRCAGISRKRFRLWLRGHVRLIHNSTISGNAATPNQADGLKSSDPLRRKPDLREHLPKEEQKWNECVQCRKLKSEQFFDVHDAGHVINGPAVDLVDNSRSSDGRQGDVFALDFFTKCLLQRVKRESKVALEAMVAEMKPYLNTLGESVEYFLAIARTRLAELKEREGIDLAKEEQFSIWPTSDDSCLISTWVRQFAETGQVPRSIDKLALFDRRKWTGLSKILLDPKACAEVILPICSLESTSINCKFTMDGSSLLTNENKRASNSLSPFKILSDFVQALEEASLVKSGSLRSFVESLDIYLSNSSTTSNDGTLQDSGACQSEVQRMQQGSLKATQDGLSIVHSCRGEPRLAAFLRKDFECYHMIERGSQGSSSGTLVRAGLIPSLWQTMEELIRWLRERTSTDSKTAQQGESRYFHQSSVKWDCLLVSEFADWVDIKLRTAAEHGSKLSKIRSEPLDRIRSSSEQINSLLAESGLRIPASRSTPRFRHWLFWTIWFGEDIGSVTNGINGPETVRRFRDQTRETSEQSKITITGVHMIPSSSGGMPERFSTSHETQCPANDRREKMEIQRVAKSNSQLHRYLTDTVLSYYLMEFGTDINALLREIGTVLLHCAFQKKSLATSSSNCMGENKIGIPLQGANSHRAASVRGAEEQNAGPIRPESVLGDAKSSTSVDEEMFVLNVSEQTVESILSVSHNFCMMHLSGDSVLHKQSLGHETSLRELQSKGPRLTELFTFLSNHAVALMRENGGAEPSQNAGNKPGSSCDRTSISLTFWRVIEAFGDPSTTYLGQLISAASDNGRLQVEADQESNLLSTLIELLDGSHSPSDEWPVLALQGAVTFLKLTANAMDFTLDMSPGGETVDIAHSATQRLSSESAAFSDTPLSSGAGGEGLTCCLCGQLFYVICNSLPGFLLAVIRQWPLLREQFARLGGGGQPVSQADRCMVREGPLTSCFCGKRQSLTKWLDDMFEFFNSTLGERTASFDSVAASLRSYLARVNTLRHQSVNDIESDESSILHLSGLALCNWVQLLFASKHESNCRMETRSGPPWTPTNGNRGVAKVLSELLLFQEQQQSQVERALWEGGNNNRRDRRSPASEDSLLQYPRFNRIDESIKILREVFFPVGGPIQQRGDAVAFTYNLCRRYCDFFISFYVKPRKSKRIIVSAVRSLVMDLFLMHPYVLAEMNHLISCEGEEEIKSLLSCHKATAAISVSENSTSKTPKTPCCCVTPDGPKATLFLHSDGLSRFITQSLRRQARRHLACFFLLCFMEAEPRVVQAIRSKHSANLQQFFATLWTQVKPSGVDSKIPSTVERQDREASSGSSQTPEKPETLELLLDENFLQRAWALVCSVI